MKNLQQIHAQLKERGCVLELYRAEDREALYEIFREVVDSGSKFPYEASTDQEFERRFFEPGSKIYICRSAEKKVIGGFYLKPNFPGRACHIANAAYMISRESRGMGLGMLLGEASLLLAKESGFSAMQYNMVLSQNLPAVNLYKKLGFSIIGTIPNAIRNPNGSYQSGYVMYRALDG